MNEQEIITRAKGHLRLGNYAKARVLLNDVATNAVAKRLLARLDKFEAQRKARLGQGGAMLATEPVQKSPEIPRPALFIIIGSMLLWAVVFIFAAASSEYSANLPLLILGVFVAFAFIVLLYYLFWRFYWWMLALAWFVSACFLLLALASGFSVFPSP